MKLGRTLTELAKEIERQQAAKQDFVADTRHLEMGSKSNVIRIAGIGQQLAVSDYAHGQIAAECGIPKKYYDMMPTELRATNVNHWWQHGTPRKRLIRTLDGVMRADLSDRYRMIDNADIAEATLPVLFERSDLEVLSCEITDRRMYIKVGFKNMLRELKVGDVVQSGVIISNSEVGSGALEIAPYLNRLWCTNGCFSSEWGTRRNHIGRALGQDANGAYEFYRDETIMLADKALLAQVQDTVRACIDEVMFGKMVGQFATTQEIKLEADPVTVVERVVKRFSFTQDEGKSILLNLINNPDLEGQRDTAFGVINAITRTAQDAESYDRATEMERLGGSLIELPAAAWKQIGVAA